MRLPQTVSPELADRDFRRFRARFGAESQSLFGGVPANPRKPRSYPTVKLEMLFRDGWLAEQSGNKLRLTIANQSLLASFGSNIRTFADAPAMRFSQTVSPETPD